MAIIKTLIRKQSHKSTTQHFFIIKEAKNA